MIREFLKVAHDCMSWSSKAKCNRLNLFGAVIWFNYFSDTEAQKEATGCYSVVRIYITVTQE